ncbi:KTSC domain-containing protein [Desemzia sp. FAM 23989]|uniref:KTSC domain-containing protein n=1 Tax=Desemzia sp. FAM 23989 TaxID=3259523 RepID=UPI003883AD7D
MIIIQRQTVSSTRIRSIGWQPNTLEIEFKDGVLYHYHGVPHSEYISFIKSSSLGSALTLIENIIILELTRKIYIYGGGATW